MGPAQHEGVGLRSSIEHEALHRFCLHELHFLDTFHPIEFEASFSRTHSMARCWMKHKIQEACRGAQDFTKSMTDLDEET